MKNYVSVLLALAFVLGLAACSSAPSPDGADSSPVLSPVTPDASSAQPEQEPSGSAAFSYETTTPEDWIYTSEESEGPAALLSSINSVPYGASGASLKQATAAAKLLELSTQPDASGSVSDFMAGMTPIQKDYFTFSWEMISREAEALFSDFEQFRPILSDAGLSDFDIGAYQHSRFIAMDEAVRALFREQNITMEWKNHTDLAPFMDAARD